MTPPAAPKASRDASPGAVWIELVTLAAALDPEELQALVLLARGLRNGDFADLVHPMLENGSA